MIACQCNAVSEDVVRAEVRLGATDVDTVTCRSGAGAECGGCLPTIVEIVADERSRSLAAIPVAG